MKKFKVGQRYTSSCWFTGASSIMEVHNVVFTVSKFETDGMHTCREEYSIDTDPQGNESVLLYKYHDSENRIFAAG